ncbi:hypothetical protein GCM10010365_67920 [Streptomyces poonensis]|uniref:Uncharacterized protein n=1 Tax=Streptomyces poonensis TaxID=68255 RepID=A0A918Q967_9ACTN|nr:hypothetical protein GCM10010365_67920 [Streptomyces poonensis]GLJ91148.1 hypothetical protein GCM10017589_37540 [Streptomyces poonensis]
MNSAGVSFTAAARPIPTPARFSRPVDSSQASPSTTASSRRFTCPKLTVSRTGSNSASRHTASPAPNRPYLRSRGPNRTYSTAADARRLSSRQSTTAVPSPTSASGSIATAANGGYVKPYAVPGTR